MLQSFKTSITFQTGLTYHRSVVFQSFKSSITFQTGLTYHRSVVFQSCFVTVGVSGGYFHGLGLRGQAHAQQFRLKTFLRGIEEDINDLRCILCTDYYYIYIQALNWPFFKSSKYLKTENCNAGVKVNFRKN